MNRRLIVAITGASGAVYGARLLQCLAEQPGWETHLVLSPSGLMTAQHELGLQRRDLEAMAAVTHNVRDIGATLASGSFRCDGMVIAPCSMRTLAAIASGLADNLIARAASVMLKERRKLVLLARETPLNLVHLRNMTAVTEAGAIVLPPMPAFYNHPRTVDDIVDHTVGRVLDLFDIDHEGLVGRWQGLRPSLRLPEPMLTNACQKEPSRASSLLPTAPPGQPVPVTILTGFLGAGKTTLLNHILTERHGYRIAVIENEFGEVDVDSDLVMTSDEEIFQMTNGCICCTVDVRTDLVRILQKLLERPEKFDHILVETSGLADPTPVAATFFMDHDVARQVALDGVVTLVDAVHIESHLDDPRLRGLDNQAIDQIVAADRIIVNKTDLVSSAAVVALEARLRRLNEGAQILRSNYAQVDLNRILGIGGFTPASARLDAADEQADDHDHRHTGHVCDETCSHAAGAHDDHHDGEHTHGHHEHDVDEVGHGHEAHGHRHDPSVTSVSLVFERPFDRARLEAGLRALLAAQGDDVFRMKGIFEIAGDERRHVVQAVHRLLDLHPAQEWEPGRRESKIVFIGRSLARARLQVLLDLCVARDVAEINPAM